MVAIKTFLVAFATIATASAVVIPVEREIAERDITLSSLVDAVLCPTGQTLFSVVNQAAIPGHSAADVWSYLGNFCSTEWQGFSTTSTTGVCNYPLSTRSFTLLGLSLTERLDINYGSSSKPNQAQTLFYQVFQLLGNPQVLETSVDRVIDLLRVTKTSTGAYVYWNVQGCSNNTATAEGIFNQVHGGAVAGTVAYFAAA